MTLPPLGIDIAKVKFNACIVRQGGKLHHKVFPNNPEGFVQLSDWLNRQGVEQVHACLEATGTYGDSLAVFLHERGHLVSMVNPAAVKAYAQSHLSRTKTDRVDASLIAGFCSANFGASSPCFVLISSSTSHSTLPGTVTGSARTYGWTEPGGRRNLRN